jgi:hypothetical protein
MLKEQIREQRDLYRDALGAIGRLASWDELTCQWVIDSRAIESIEKPHIRQLVRDVLSIRLLAEQGECDG